MINKKVIVKNPKGLHARPSALIAKTAIEYESTIYLVRDSVRANAKIVMEILMLCAQYGSEITVDADGPDQEDALAGVENAILTEFPD